VLNTRMTCKNTGVQLLCFPPIEVKMIDKVERLEEPRKLHKFERPGELRKRLLTFIAIAVPLFVMLKIVLG